MKKESFISKYWKEIRKVYIIITILSFISAVILSFLFKEYTYIIGSIFGFILSLWVVFLRSKPNQSILESAVGESYYKKHKRTIWILFIILMIIIIIFLAIILPQIG